MNRLTLIGMPGSGKSALGRIIATRLGWQFIDTDLCIERRFGKKLQAVVDQVGTEEFARIEEETVLGLTSEGAAVISTGGSVVYSEAAMRHLASISTIVFLDVPIHRLHPRIARAAPRGIVGMGEGGLEELYRRRFELYHKYAHSIVLLDGENLQDAATRIISQCGVS
ncbi:shikimate kinase [Geomonas sp. Red69]|uniref:Shikimate kinase n=1 Tax=Geomonas diazotrophica TaxID=2843197 RepID=A0ABX8JKC9_9BACT|nr:MULTISPECIES: shikimate kinase [Geomonas]MBU5635373.1 shikimate kinase [Geomonas diazotrophica]QWV97571.1 shikimate kinase [Geomonas nitrogeniifigens]QXE86712.1 shikimate kinase [Geomonas nitrogeniifigens]